MEVDTKKFKGETVFVSPEYTTLHQQLGTAFVQFMVSGKSETPRQAALKVLEGLAALPDLDDTEAKLARCQGCDQSLMGQAWEVDLQDVLSFINIFVFALHIEYACRVSLWLMQGLKKQALSTNMFCMKCHKAGMQLHRLLSRSELETCQRFLRATPILDFCANHNEVSAVGLYVCNSGLNTHATLMLCNIDIELNTFLFRQCMNLSKTHPMSHNVLVESKPWHRRICCHT